MLGADTRSTAGTTVADKNCEKIHYIAPNIYCCGAGTAADTENVRADGSSLRCLAALVSRGAQRLHLIGEPLYPDAPVVARCCPCSHDLALLCRPPMRCNATTSTSSTGPSCLLARHLDRSALPAPALPCPQVTGMVASQLELHRLATGTQSRVITAMTLLKSHLFRCAAAVCCAAAQRQLSAAPVLNCVPVAARL